MNLTSALPKVGISLVAIVLAVAGYRYVSTTTTPAAVPELKEAVPSGLIRFAPNAPQLSSLKIATVTEVPLPVSDALNGRITYDENVTTRVSSPILGRVTALHAEIGDVVKRGTVLADIDSPDLATAEADWRKAQADELRKKLAQQRAKTLLEGEVLARKDYESAQADFQQANAETRRTIARMKNLNAAGTEDGRFSLKAQFAGTVVDRQINPGLEVRPDLPNPLFVITDFSRLWVIVDVPERSATELHAGQSVSIDTDAWPDERFVATIERIGLALDPVTRRIQVRCTVRNPDRKLKPEMFARVAFLADGDGKKAIPVPNTSLFIDGIYSYVFVEKQPGDFEKRRVNVRLRGRETSYVDTGLNANLNANLNTSRNSGLNSGERVVTEGAFLLNAEGAADVK
ncbi:efflux RND transporter periplasmic adaptor subunit [Actimicrobium antarcticum]|uniref:Efflux RND transporter periplasmic adaptor subunit n=1 Tax=Actimicrobium antarcticum TaxID=1051899 RepID=A0ABP7T752_9BURK